MQKEELKQELARAFNINGADSYFNKPDHALADAALRYLDRAFGFNPDRADKAQCQKADRNDQQPMAATFTPQTASPDYAGLAERVRGLKEVRDLAQANYNGAAGNANAAHRVLASAQSKLDRSFAELHAAI